MGTSQSRVSTRSPEAEMSRSERRNCPSPQCSLLIAIRSFILVITCLGLATIVTAFAFLTVTSATLRFLIVVIGLVLVGVSALAWKLTSMDLVDERPTRNQRLPAFLPFPPDRCPSQLIPTISGTIPVFGSRHAWSVILDLPPAVLVPPPPSYTQSESHLQGLHSVSVAPPQYDAARRVSSSSPPPRYFDPPQNEAVVSLNPRGAGSTSFSIIDCSKAVPTMIKIEECQEVV